MIEKRDFLTLSNYAPEEIYRLLAKGLELKRDPAGLKTRQALAGQTVALIFKKPSTRTRVSFEAAVAQLGGHPVYLSGADLQLARGETIEDTGKVLARYVQALVMRTFDHAEVEDLAAASVVPVINALTDDHHPCQALADLLTILEKKSRLSGIRLAYIGDGNNVCNSLMIAAAKMEMDFVAACPSGYEPQKAMVRLAHDLAGGRRFLVTDDPAEAATGADILYTDVWTSMGRETEEKSRLNDFSGFQLNNALLNKAKPDAMVMHCLPAHRSQEITAEVMDGPQSIVFEQAENRLYAQKALLLFLLDGD